jgi:glycosyltransferase involved in cell wall biosynthesis
MQPATTQEASPRTPVVSVVIPTHNRAGLLRRAVDSVLAQTIGEWECIIIDDASSDDTAGLLQRLCAGDVRFRAQRMQQHSGNTMARASGCDLARGEFIAILDDDDWWEPAKLQKQVESLRQHPGAAWSYHGAQLISINGPGPAEHVEHNRDFLKRLLEYNWLRHSSMMIRREAFEAIGGYDRRLARAADWDLVIRLTLRYGRDAIVVLPDLLVNYWCHQDNISARAAVRVRAERRIVCDTLLRRGLLWRHPLLALRMADRQLDREMHSALADGHYARAFAQATLSAVAWPMRGWRWQRAARFCRAALTREHPADIPSELRSRRG